jgi:prolyl-tRNA editing enzyme YbaK/EbsC (Cys-tRNA(Pro) deacylase)
MTIWMELLLKDEVVLVMLGGNAKIDYQKFKGQFKTKAKMLNVDEVVEWTSHPVGGVCPFGVPHALRIFADVTLKKFDVVLPAAGATNAALRITPERLVQLVPGNVGRCRTRSLLVPRHSAFTKGVADFENWEWRLRQLVC